jgi:hypothetical protein
MASSDDEGGLAEALFAERVLEPLDLDAMFELPSIILMCRIILLLFQC